MWELITQIGDMPSGGKKVEVDDTPWTLPIAKDDT
jgi:hypothetical protein